MTPETHHSVLCSALQGLRLHLIETKWRNGLKPLFVFFLTEFSQQSMLPKQRAAPWVRIVAAWNCMHFNRHRVHLIFLSELRSTKAEPAQSLSPNTYGYLQSKELFKNYVDNTSQVGDTGWEPSINDVGNLSRIFDNPLSHVSNFSNTVSIGNFDQFLIPLLSMANVVYGWPLFDQFLTPPPSQLPTSFMDGSKCQWCAYFPL